MNAQINIRLLEAHELESIIPLVQLLNPKQEPSILKERLKEMVERGYKCVGVFVDERLAGVAGLWILTKLYVGRHLEPDNVILAPEYQGKGLGKLLFEWIDNYARSHGCVALELNCYVNNSLGQKFWMNEGYRILGFHFQKRINDL